MSEVQSYPVPDGWADTAWINKTNYQQMYRESVEKPDSFWASQATEFLMWDAPWT
ncbi:MAG: acetyl-CoA synthetase, partial [Porticoccaceae bacterium]